MATTKKRDEKYLFGALKNILYDSNMTYVKFECPEDVNKEHSNIHTLTFDYNEFYQWIIKTFCRTQKISGFSMSDHREKLIQYIEENSGELYSTSMDDLEYEENLIQSNESKRDELLKKKRQALSNTKSKSNYFSSSTDTDWYSRSANKEPRCHIFVSSDGCHPIFGSSGCH